MIRKSGNVLLVYAIKNQFCTFAQSIVACYGVANFSCGEKSLPNSRIPSIGTPFTDPRIGIRSADGAEQSCYNFILETMPVSLIACH